MNRAAKVTAASTYAKLYQKRITYPYASLLRPGLSPTLRRFKKLAVDHPKKYKAYMELISWLEGEAKKGGMKDEITLHLPSRKALPNIDVEYLVRSPSALEDVRKECYSRSLKNIDLRPLEKAPWMFFPGMKRLNGK